jgi:hypothetical protein
MVVRLTFWYVTPSWDTSNDVISDPALGPGHVPGVLVDCQFDHNADLHNSGPRRTLHARIGWAPAKDAGGKDRTAEQCGNHGRRSVDWDPLADWDVGKLQIVYNRHRNTVGVEHLAVEEVQLGVQPASCLIVATPSHCPAPVMIKSGIAAKAAARMITK